MCNLFGRCHTLYFGTQVFKTCLHLCITILACFPVNGTDFSSTATLFNFEVGAVSQACIDVLIIDDDDLEGDHTFTVKLGRTNTPALGRTGFPTSTTITIQDPEGMHFLNVDSPRKNKLIIHFVWIQLQP